MRIPNLNTSPGRLNAAKAICHLLSDKLADQVKLVKTPKLNSVADYFIVATVTSKAHMDALEKYIKDAFKERRIQNTKSVEGRESPQWRVIDRGFVVIHLMDKEARQKYRLQDIWSDTKEIKWNAAKPTKKSKKR